MERSEHNPEHEKTPQSKLLRGERNKERREDPSPVGFRMISRERRSEGAREIRSPQ